MSAIQSHEQQDMSYEYELAWTHNALDRVLSESPENIRREFIRLLNTPRQYRSLIIPHIRNANSAVMQQKAVDGGAL